MAIVTFDAEEYTFTGFPEQLKRGWQMVRLINHGRDVHQRSDGIRGLSIGREEEIIAFP